MRKAVEATGQSSGSNAEELVGFLARERNPDDHILLSTALQKGATVGLDAALPVIARATLLLRLASAACGDHLRLASIGAAHLKFWWESFGDDYGLWDTGAPPGEFGDLWKDIEDALVEVGNWCDTNRTHPPSVKRSRAALAATFPQLCSFQRACLWGLGLVP